MESAASEKDRSGPIFILGAVESGTALVRLLLDRHPHIAIPQETGFGRALLAQQQIPFWSSGDRWWSRLGYTDEAFTAHLRDFYGAMFRHYAEQHGKQRWGEETPYHVWHVDRLAEVFHDAVFVAIVRHPGGNVGSLQRRFKYTYKRGVNHWLETNRELLALTEEHSDRMVLCRYEDLVLHPEAAMRELLEWLGEPWSPVVLEHSHEAFDASGVAQWAEQLDARGLQMLRNRTVSLGSIFGYDVHEPVPAAPMGNDGTLLMTGVEAAARLAQIRPAILELRIRPEPRLADQPLDPRKVGPSAEHGRKERRKPKTPAKQPAAGAAGKRRPAKGAKAEKSAKTAKGAKPPPAAKSARARLMSRLPQRVRRRLRRLLSRAG